MPKAQAVPLVDADAPKPRRRRADLPPPPAAFSTLDRRDRWTTLERIGVGEAWRAVLPPNSLLLRAVVAHPQACEIPWSSPTGERAFSVPAEWVRIVPPRKGRKAAVPMPALPKRIEGVPVPAETCIAWSEADASAEVYTTEQAVARRLCRQGFSPTPGQAGVGLSFSVPRAAVKLRPKREASEAQREAAARALGKAAGKVGVSPLPGILDAQDAG